MLQTRGGKRTAKASVKIAVDMVKEGMLTEQEALLRVKPEMMDFFLHPSIDPASQKTVIAKGLPASPGAKTGMIVFNSDVSALVFSFDEIVCQSCCLLIPCSSMFCGCLRSR